MREKERGIQTHTKSDSGNQNEDRQVRSCSLEVEKCCETSNTRGEGIQYVADGSNQTMRGRRRD